MSVLDNVDIVTSLIQNNELQLLVCSINNKRDFILLIF